MPVKPWSQPPMTIPAPSWKVKSSRPQDASNSLPSGYVTPTYFTVTCLPDTASAPVPLTRSEMTRLHGGGPSGISICGFLDRSVLPVACATGACEVQAEGAAGGDAAAVSPPRSEARAPLSPLPEHPVRAAVRAVATA